ncbi:MAG TPA: DoxX family protein [Candidatus Limnocylindrales bacterium]|nr:DoxX family protein [Candidatus Limnocylindrales bacterium]
MDATLAAGLLVLRVIFGLTVAAHGAQKLFGWFGGPGIERFGGMLEQLGLVPASKWSWVAALAEFGGGLLVALGLLSPIGNFLVIGGMLTAILLVHLRKGFFNAKGGMELPFLIAAGVLGLSLTGPGAWSLDAVWRVRLPEPATWLACAVLTLLGVALAIGVRATRTANVPRQARGAAS